jgi:hypothetical protein
VPTGDAESEAIMLLSASRLSMGSNTITAVYSGNSVYGSSTSAPIMVTLQ